MVFKNLLRRKTRTFLTLLGIAIGVAAVTALGALAEGFVNSYTTMLTSSGADIILAQEDAPDILFSAVDTKVGPQLANVRGIRQISGVLVGMVSTPDVPYFIIFGLDPKEFGLRHYAVVEGRAIAQPRQILMGRTAARSFHKKVGDYFKVQAISFQIVGIYETGQGVEENGGVISLRDAQEVFKKPNQVAYYQVQVQRPEVINGVIAELEQRFPKLTASRSANYMDSQQETQLLRAMSWFIGLFAVVAGGLVMMNTMLMSVFERTREIGVLRALGWKRGRVLRLILGEALVLSIAGGLLGNAIGLSLVWAVNQTPVLAGFMDNAFTPALFFQGMVIALLLGAAGGAYPAWRAAGLQPVEAMRYDGTGTHSHAASRGRACEQRPGVSGNHAVNVNPAPMRVGGMTLRNLLRQRQRTLLTTLAIGIGVGLVVTLGGMADGMIAQMSGMGSQSGDLTITEAKASDMSLAAIDDKVGRYAATLQGVAHVSGLLLGIASVPGTPYFIVFGMEPTSFAMRHFAITQGTRIQAPRDIVIGKVAAKNLKKHVGDRLQVLGTSYRVSGIYETGIAMEDAGGVLALQEAQRVFQKPNQVSFYMLKLRDPGDADAVRRQMETRWPQVSVSRSTEFAEKTNDMRSFRSMTGALSFLSILIGGVGMMNAMLMSVHERTREIGTLRALGWRRRRVIGMILREALLLSLLSGIAGIVIGMGLGMLITLEPTMGSMLQPSYSVGLLVQALGVALVLGAVGALYPAWRASNLSPIEALRYE